MAYQGAYSLPTIGGYGRSSASFNNQQVGQEFLKAAQLSAGATPFGQLQGLSAGQYFTGPGGTEYRTVAGIDPNQPGWGNRVPTGYELIGYQQGSTGERPLGRRAYSQAFDVPGFAVLKKIAPPPVQQAAAPAAVATAPVEQTAPTQTTAVDTGPSESEIMAQQLSASIASLSKSFEQRLATQQAEFQRLAEEQAKRFETLQNQFQAQTQMAQRPDVMGVKTAAGSSGDAMQIARRGVRGAFGRRGMRIKGLNVG